MVKLVENGKKWLKMVEKLVRMIEKWLING
jgi:hypothetical protein